MALNPDDICSHCRRQSPAKRLQKPMTAQVIHQCAGHITYPQTAFSGPEFQYQTYLRTVFKRTSGGRSAHGLPSENEFSTHNRTVHFTPLCFRMLQIIRFYTHRYGIHGHRTACCPKLNDYVSIQGSLTMTYTNRE